MENKVSSPNISLEIWIALGTIFVYSVTILMQYGFLSYYGVPYFAIEPSIRDNIIFVYTIIKVITNLTPLIIVKIILPVLLVTSVLIFTIYKFFSYTKIRNFNIVKQITFDKYLNKLKWPFIMLLVLYSLHLFFILGFKTAEIHKDVYKLSEGCGLVQEENYFISEFYQSKPIILYYNDQKEILDKFSIIDITNTGCSLEKITIEGLHKKSN